MIILIDSISIIGGYNKSGVRESISELNLYKGNIYSIVGNTGSGKTQLMEDIESLNQGEGSSKRLIKINGSYVDDYFFTGLRSRFIAHLSQNMNFILDISVLEFLTYRYDQIRETCRQDPLKPLDLLNYANTLSGEEILREQSLNKLSGGQSRALMITDVALNSEAPVILIDELENAGIDRIKALKLLAKRDKIVLMVTHDPLLALYGDYRIVLKNGGIYNFIKRSDFELEHCNRIQEWYSEIDNYRTAIRSGEKYNLLGVDI